jgi:hypothetical protein
LHRDWVDYATLAATVGAAGGTVGAVWIALRQARDQFKTKARIWSPHVVTTPSTSTVTIKVHNMGLRPMTVEQIAFYGASRTALDFSRKDTYRGTTLPETLQPGETFTQLYERRSDPQAEIPEKPFYLLAVDSSGQHHMGYYDPIDRPRGRVTHARQRVASLIAP